MNIIPGSIHVLHVDDEPRFVELASEFLERENDRITVKTATSASEGLNYLAENDFDCIISDYEMPGQDGIEFLHAVRSEYPDLPFILFTGKGSEEVASEAISAGVTDYLQKKSGTEQYKILAKRLQNYVERARAQRQRENMRERMEMALEHTDSIIFEVDLDTGKESRHGSFENIFGIPVEKVPTLEEHQELAVHPEDRERVQTFFEQLADGERESGEIEYRTNPEKGSVRWIRDIVHVESNGGSRHVIGLAHDITDRKEREREFERYEKIVESSDDGIYVFDEEGRFEFVNQRVVDVSGIPQEAWVGEHVSIHTDLGTLTQEEVTAIEGAIDAIVRGEEDEVRLEMTPDVPHDLQTLELRLTPFRSGEGGESVIAFSRDITERKSYERELETIQERIGFALDATDSMIYEIDLNTSEETRHGPFERLYGLPPDQVTTAWEFYEHVVHPDDRDELEQRHEKAVSGEIDHFDIEFRLHPDLFENRWIDTKGYVQEGPDGEPLRLIGLSTNITRLKEKEEELKENMGKIESLHDVARSIEACETEQEVCDLTIEGARDILEFDICVINLEEDGYLPITAISSDVPPEGATKMSVEEGIAGKTYRTGESFLIEDVKDAEEADPQGPYRSAISVPVGDYGVFQAVSEEVGFFDEDDLELAELLVSHTVQALNRVKTQDRLRRERDRFAVIFRNIPDPAIRVEFEDDEPIVRAINPAFERVFGYDEDTIVGGSPNEYIVPPELEGEAEDLDRRSLAGETVEVEVRRQTADGELRDFLFRTALLERDDSGIEGYGIYTDITDIKEYERQIERQNERLEEFVNVVSHDLRNPLTVARGYLGLELNERESENLTKVDSALNRMENIVEDTLTLAREGRKVGKTEEIDLKQVVERCWASVDTGDASIVTVGDLGSIEGDKGRLSHLFENLFRNSVEHAGGDVTIRVGMLENGFYVEDDGPGIPEEEREEVFEYGYSTREKGTGFGLSIVKSIVEAHGWEISISESEEGGARFEVTGVN